MTETYDSRRDSSPGTDDLRDDAPGADLDNDGQPMGVDGLILEVDDVKGSQTCACGCGRRVAGKAKFVQGHDQCLIGKLLRAHRGGVEVALRQGGMMTHMSPESYARLVLTGAGVAKFAAAAARPVASPRTRQAPQTPTGKLVGTVKVGRWAYPAQKSDANDAPVRYNTKRDGSGEWKTADAKVAATFTPTV